MGLPWILDIVYHELLDCVYALNGNTVFTEIWVDPISCSGHTQQQNWKAPVLLAATITGSSVGLQVTAKLWSHHTWGCNILPCFVKQLEIWIVTWKGVDIYKGNWRRPFWELCFNCQATDTNSQCLSKVLGQVAIFSNFTFLLQACSLTQGSQKMMV